MKDFATAERKRFIENFSAFHKDEGRIPYLCAWMFALMFGTRMPHERYSPLYALKGDSK
jgi:hypothetical protein